jgi:GH15 family glucan-1,4-alpha-glucosidase
VGNAASEQLQLDVYGEVIGALHLARTKDLASPASAWAMQCEFMSHLETIWNLPDEGIWEVRGGRRQFTFSKVMAWVALDRSISDAVAFNFPAPLDHWRSLREQMHAEICAKGFDPVRNAFTQSFGSPHLDASLLLIPRTGFLPVSDPRVAGTIRAIEQDLLVDGFVLRYRTETGTDGLPPGEGAFLPCSFWLADAYSRQGRDVEARAMFQRLVNLSNDVGLLTEEYDPRAGRLVGNFPQAFSHMALIGSALTMHDTAPAQQR